MTEIRITGKAAPARAAEAALRALVQEQFGIDAAARPVEPDNDDPRRGLVEWLSLAFAIPGGVIAAIDLAQRLELVPKLRRLIGLAAEQKQANGVRLLIDVGDGIPRPLDGVTPEQILDAVARLKPDR